MISNDWISINEYSVKYNISQSTLRRRIRNGDIENKFQHGKYWLLDKPIFRYSRPLQNSDTPAAEMKELQTNPADSLIATTNQIDGFMESANKIMSELKGAYVTVLHEKEMQIMQLKEEITNLKTLIKILESENDRLTSNIKESTPIDSWLDKNFE